MVRHGRGHGHGHFQNALLHLYNSYLITVLYSSHYFQTQRSFLSSTYPFISTCAEDRLAHYRVILLHTRPRNLMHTRRDPAGISNITLTGQALSTVGISVYVLY